MTLRTSIQCALALFALVAAGTGCSRKAPTAPWPASIEPVVFTEGFGPRVEYQAFGGSKLDALSVDTKEAHTGTSSLKFSVPASANPAGGYAGGAFVTRLPRDLASYNALSFWIKGSRSGLLLPHAGLGNDNTGLSLYTAEVDSTAIKTWWTQVLIPIPLPDKLMFEKGLFFISISGAFPDQIPAVADPFSIWIDDVQFVNTPAVRLVRPVLTTRTLDTFVDFNESLKDLTNTTFSVNGANRTVHHMPQYFSFQSDNPAVATVAGGSIRVLGEGTAIISAKLGASDVTGSITVNARPALTPAPTPSLPANQVISLFSNAYPNAAAVNWRAFALNGTIQYEDVVIAGNDTKLFKNLVGYVGMQWPPLNITGMSYFHIDAWLLPGASSPIFNIKLVDFGPDGISNFPAAGDDTQYELLYNATTTPAVTSGTWLSFDIPLSNFIALRNPAANIAQLILTSNTSKVFVDNIYFHQ